MKKNGSAAPGRENGQPYVQGMIVKVKPQGDGTLKFDVTCHHASGEVAHRQSFFLPPKSELQGMVKKNKGHIAYVEFDSTGKEREIPTLINVLK